MLGSLENLSNELARLVEQYQSDVVTVHGRSRYPSSGVHWRPGIIVTADHTIQQEEDIQVTLPGGETADASLAGRDAGTDIAFLKVEGFGSPKNVNHAAQNDPAKVGELALVLGRSPDSGPNASLGVISAVSGPWRTWRGGRLENYVRLDATLFPNSSGGAVIDCRGRLLGIATSALSRIAGLAIPAVSINRVIDRLLEKGYLPRAYIGVGLQPVAIPESLRTALSLRNQCGVMIVSLQPDGPAEQAGVLLGDILVNFAGEPLETVGDLQSLSDSAMIGKPVKVQLIRANAIAEATITIGERPGK